MSHWSAQAACKDKPAKWWFPEGGTNPERAKRVCDGCPVNEQCLAFALTTRQEHGIWAGFDFEQRRKMKSHRLIYCRECGTKFLWPPSAGVQPPIFCSSVCRNKSRQASRAQARQRRKLSA